MTDDAEYKGRLHSVVDLAQEAVGNGSAALDETNKALFHVMQAIGELEAARTFALQKLGNLNDIVKEMEFILRGTMNVDALEAQQFFISARNDIQDFSNRIALAIDKQRQYLDVLTINRRDRELRPSGSELYKGVTALTRYIQAI